MSNSYWNDERYVHAILGRLPDAQLVKLNNYPFALLQLCKENVKHMASLPGFISARSLDVLDQQIIDLKNIAQDMNVLSAFVQYRGAESLEDINGLLHRHFSSNCFDVQCRTRVCVNVAQNDGGMLQKCRKDTRSRLRKIGRGDLHFSGEYNVDFCGLYQDIAHKNKFSSAYCYSDQGLLDIAGASGVFPVSIYDAQKKYIGGSILGHVGQGEVDYILSAYDNTYNNSGRAVLWYSLLAAQSLGYSTVNLGGGVAEGDSLYDFKMSFGGASVPFYTIKIVLNEGQYRDAYKIDGDISFEGRFPR